MLPRCDRKLRHAAFCGLGYATTILVCGKDLDLSSLVRRGCAVLSCCRHVVYPTYHMRRDRWLTDVREDDCEEAICLAAMMGEGESFTRVSMLTCNLSGPSDFIIKKKRLSRRDAHAMVGRTRGNSTTAVKRADACNRGDHLFNTRTELIKLAHNRRPERRSVQSPKKGVAPRYSVTLPLVYLHVTASQSWTPSAAVACTQ